VRKEESRERERERERKESRAIIEK